MDCVSRERRGSHGGRRGNPLWLPTKGQARGPAPTEPEIVSWVVGAYGHTPLRELPDKDEILHPSGEHYHGRTQNDRNAHPRLFMGYVFRYNDNRIPTIETIQQGLSDLDIIVKEALSGGMRRNHEVWGNWSRLSRELGIVRESFYRSPTIILSFISKI